MKLILIGVVCLMTNLNWAATLDWPEEQAEAPSADRRSNCPEQIPYEGSSVPSLPLPAEEPSMFHHTEPELKQLAELIEDYLVFHYPPALLHQGSLRLFDTDFKPNFEYLK